MANDLQLQSVRLEAVLEKRRLDQALNAKEFAVLAGISYSTAREWFRLLGFPVLVQELGCNRVLTGVPDGNAHLDAVSPALPISWRPTR